MARNTIEKQIEELGIKVNGTAPEGSNITEKLTSFVDEYQGGQELPAQLGTAGQVLTVNSNADGVEWANAGGGSQGVDIDITTTESTGTTVQMLLDDLVSKGLMIKDYMGYHTDVLEKGIKLNNFKLTVLNTNSSLSNKEFDNCWIATTNKVGNGMGGIASIDFIILLEASFGRYGYKKTFNGDLGYIDRLGETLLNMTADYNSNGYEYMYLTPTKPSDANSKTYVLKLVNGKLTWVE